MCCPFVDDRLRRSRSKARPREVACKRSVGSVTIGYQASLSCTTGRSFTLEYGTLEPDARPTWHVRIEHDGQPERILSWDQRPHEVTVADLTHWLEDFIEQELAATLALNAWTDEPRSVRVFPRLNSASWIRRSPGRPDRRRGSGVGGDWGCSHWSAIGLHLRRHSGAVSIRWTGLGSAGRAARRPSEPDLPVDGDHRGAVTRASNARQGRPAVRSRTRRTRRTAAAKPMVWFTLGAISAVRAPARGRARTPTSTRKCVGQHRASSSRRGSA